MKPRAQTKQKEASQAHRAAAVSSSDPAASRFLDNNSVNLASLQNSLENGLPGNSNKSSFGAAVTGIMVPMAPKFQFQERRERLNWRLISDVDLDKITSEVDLRAVEGLL